MVYYRKYRPQTLDQLIGQEHVKESLKKAFVSGHLSHAYLFCGPKGTGKTSTARILAKMVNCERSISTGPVASVSQVSPRPDKIGAAVDAQELSSAPPAVPCNKCSNCISITNGSNLDLIEIDAASNRGIDDIRDLRDKIKLSPTKANKKVYIIDEVHMLTPEAFNALLKTLEEPPAHVMFILATTEPNKIPSTILSRVQRLDFKEASSEQLLISLEKVAREENLDVKSDVLALIAQKSEGSFRDCLKILDQLAASNEKITQEVVEQIIRSGKFEEVAQLLEYIARKDSKNALEKVSALVEGGIIIKEFMLSVMEHLRIILLINAHANQQIKDDLSEKKYKRVENLSKVFRLKETIQVLDFFQEGLERLRSATIPHLVLELAVLESCIALGETIKKSEEISKETAPVILAVSPSSSGSSDLDKLLDKWTYVLETIRPYNFSLEALLRQVKVLSCDDAIVLLEVPYTFHQRILESPKSRTLLESVLADVLGKSVKVSCVLGVRPVRADELSNVEIAADDEVIRVAAEIFNSEVN